MKTKTGGRTMKKTKTGGRTMKKTTKLCTMILAVLMLASSIAMLAAPAVSAATGTDYFTRVDISTDVMQASANGADRWQNGDDDGAKTLAQVCPKDGAVANNCVIMSDVKLDAGKAYTIEVKARFAEGYANPNTNSGPNESRGFGLIVGAKDRTPWESTSRHYTAMFDRGELSGKDFRVFTKYYKLENDQETLCNKEVSSEAFQSTDWHTIRFTISEEGVLAVYLDGVKAGETTLDGKKSDGTDLANEIWEGGYIGVIAYAVKTKVEFKDLCYKEGVTEAPATFADDNAPKRDIKINYVYEDGSKAAESVTVTRAEGAYYAVESPKIAGFVAEQMTVSGTAGNQNTEITVKYFKSYKVTVHYVDKNGTTMNADVVVTDLKNGDTYSVDTMNVPNYKADKALVSGTIDNADVEVTVTYSLKTNTLTIKYLYEDGSVAHDDYVAEVEYDGDYNVVSPEIAGFTPDKTAAVGEGMRAPQTITVTYKKAEAAEAPAETEPAKKKGCGNSIAAMIIPIAIAAGAATVIEKKRK